MRTVHSINGVWYVYEDHKELAAFRYSEEHAKQFSEVPNLVSNLRAILPHVSQAQGYLGIPYDRPQVVKIKEILDSLGV